MDNTFDKLYYKRGELIGGVDEAGVTDIAGPLVAACVILPKIKDLSNHDLRLFEVNDSKQIPEKYRRQHAEVVWENAVAIGIGEVSPVEFDYIGIWSAIALAQTRAIAACKRIGDGERLIPDFLLIDASVEANVDIPHENIDRGDEKSLCVAAASIVAKVYRDNEMINLHKEYPWYGWDSNKGFKCEKHFQGLDEYGLVPGVHRTRTFPFIAKPKHVKQGRDKDGYNPKTAAFWGRRRRKWKHKTEERLVSELGEEDIWTIKKPYYERSKSLKNSTAETGEQKPSSKKQSSQPKEKPAPTASS